MKPINVKSTKTRVLVGMLNNLSGSHNLRLLSKSEKTYFHVEDVTGAI